MKDRSWEKEYDGLNEEELNEKAKDNALPGDHLEYVKSILQTIADLNDNFRNTNG